jgi:hypothetical protein
MSQGTYITFVEGPAKPKTKTWRVLSEREELLGIVKWYGPWRTYAFHPEGWTVFEKTCLRDIANFCESETKKQKGK